MPLFTVDHARIAATFSLSKEVPRMQATEVIRRIESDLETLYKLCKQGLSDCGARHDAREYPLIEQARIEIAQPLARFRIVTEKLAARL